MEKYLKILIVIVVLGGAGFFAYNQIIKWHKGGLNNAIEREQAEWQEKTWILEEEITSLQKKLAEHKDALAPEEKLFEVFGETPIVISPKQEEISCEDLERQITAFFKYLDGKEYLIPYNLGEGTYNQFRKIVKQLSITPPMAAGETNDFFSLIRNVSHFYSALGKKRIEQIKEILNNESEIIESVMPIFFTWLISKERCKEKLKGNPSLKILYKYAGFFQNTLGGRSYLLRRDSKVRILASYYCVLIIDMANEESLNSDGIDIRPYLNLLYYEILDQKGLIYKKQYLAELEILRDKY